MMAESLEIPAVPAPCPDRRRARQWPTRCRSIPSARCATSTAAACRAGDDLGPASAAPCPQRCVLAPVHARRRPPQHPPPGRDRRRPAEDLVLDAHDPDVADRPGRVGDLARARQDEDPAPVRPPPAATAAPPAARPSAPSSPASCTATRRPSVPTLRPCPPRRGLRRGGTPLSPLQQMTVHIGLPEFAGYP